MLSINQENWWIMGQHQFYQKLWIREYFLIPFSVILAFNSYCRNLILFSYLGDEALMTPKFYWTHKYIILYHNHSFAITCFHSFEIHKILPAFFEFNITGLCIVLYHLKSILCFIDVEHDIHERKTFVHYIYMQ